MQPQNPNNNEQAASPASVSGPAPVVTAQPTPQPQSAVEFAAQQDAAIQQNQEEEFEDEETFDLSQPVKWQAKEFVHQEKNTTWFVLFGVVFVVFMGIAVFLMQSWTFAALLVVIAVVIVVLAKRPPRLMSYSLSDKGLHIGDTLHSFSDFRAFGVVHDGQEYSVMLIPTKRFLPGVTVYFPEESGEEIVDALGSRLPMQELRLDFIDRIVRKLRLG